MSETNRPRPDVFRLYNTIIVIFKIGVKISTKVYRVKVSLIFLFLY